MITRSSPNEFFAHSNNTVLQYGVLIKFKLHNLWMLLIAETQLIVKSIKNSCKFKYSEFI